jgi:hypothetical protein
MKKLIITLAIIFINVSSLNSQSLKNFSNNKDLSSKDTIYSLYSDITHVMKNNKVSNIKDGDFISISTGFMIKEDKNPLFGALDLNINLGFISDFIYLNMGIYGIYRYSKNSNAFSAHITPGLGFYFFKERIFTFAGVGYLIIIPVLSYDFVLIINYLLTKQLSIGINNKLIPWGKSSNNKNIYIYSIGANFSYRYNF